MRRWFLFFCLSVFAYARPNDHDRCSSICVGNEYECIKGRCYCAEGYVPDPFQTGCIACPGLGEQCYGTCCNSAGNETLQCWQGVCQTCYDNNEVWVCRDSLEQILWMSITQVIMASALVLGIIATFILLYKLCAVTSLRSIGSNSNPGGRLSIGSLQIYVEQRLRDAPPRYSRAPPTATACLEPTYLNAGFVHDSSVPPPPYLGEPQNLLVKEPDNQNSTVHM